VFVGGRERALSREGEMVEHAHFENDRMRKGVVCEKVRNKIENKNADGLFGRRAAR
jgi:hypothetical protein